ncbi:MAG TPA: preprotein translocase subunit YajC [Amycolatopsis sp.]|jgi:preprotein translocase subunit YajC|nr:preprotein translocase subunit YajC [Amycolatopsis sp.]
MNQLFLPLLLMLVVAIPLVMGSRKQKRAAREQQQLQNGLAEGDRVMTTSGLYGTVADVSSETTIDVEIAPGVVTTWLRQAVREKVAPEVPEVDDEVIEHEAITEPETVEAKVDAVEEKAEAADDELAQSLEPEKK